MMRGMAAMLAAVLFANATIPAACAFAQAAAPFPEVSVPAVPRGQSHRGAYAAILTGAGLVAGSFVFEHRADQAYDRYLSGTDPGEIESAYDDARRYDNLSTATLLTGEALVGIGLY